MEAAVEAESLAPAAVPRLGRRFQRMLRGSRRERARQRRMEKAEAQFRRFSRGPSRGGPLVVEVEVMFSETGSSEQFFPTR